MNGTHVRDEELALAERLRKAGPARVGKRWREAVLGEPPLAGWSDAPCLGDAQTQYQHFSGWVYASIRPIAQRIAGQPARLARLRQGAGRSKAPFLLAEAGPAWTKSWNGEFEPVTVHPLLDALAQPNELMVAWSLMYVTVASLELTGRAFWWLCEADGRTTIWPVPVHWVSPRSGGGWRIRPAGTATPIDIAACDLAPFHYPHPADPTGCVSPLQTQARAVRADESIQTAQDHAFRNGIRPGYAVVAGDALAGDGTARRPVLTPDQRRQLVTCIKQMYRGAARWDEPIILDGMIKDIHKITHAPAEMDFLNSGRVTKQRITQGFGVNPAIMGELEGANRASALAAREHFCEFTVNPKLELLSQVMTRWIGPRFAARDERLAVWLEPCRAVDPEEQRKEEEHLLRAGALSVNELRLRHGLPRLADGDAVWLPAGSVRVEVARGEGSGAKAVKEEHHAAKSV